MQASVLDGFAFDPFSFQQDGLTASEARNVAFISNLMESGVEFEAVDFPQANRLTIHIMATMAEHEAKIVHQSSPCTRCSAARNTRQRSWLVPWHRRGVRHQVDRSKSKPLIALTNRCYPIDCGLWRSTAGTRQPASSYQNSQILTYVASAPPGHSLQKRTVVQWDMGAVLGRDGATDELMSPHFGISPTRTCPCK